MAEGLLIRLEGFDQLFALLQKAPEILTQEVAVNLHDGALAIQGEAKNRVTAQGAIDNGTLRNEIKIDDPRNNGLTIGVSAHAEYSAYVEFGTGTKVDVPAGLEDYAIQFKGQKEIIGMHARPFLFPAVANQTPKIVANLKKSLEKALSK